MGKLVGKSQKAALNSLRLETCAGQIGEHRQLVKAACVGGGGVYGLWRGVGR